jgi:hypothetical protein
MMINLSEEQRLMRQSCRDFVDDLVCPSELVPSKP